MGLKKYFKGRSGTIFWVNVILAIVVLVSIPIVIFNTLDMYTNHGEKVSVPSVIGDKYYEAESTLDSKGFVAIVADSTYRKSAKPGTVLEQTPKAGSLIKTGRIVYLTINLNGEPLTKMPDIVGNSSYREAEITLKALGFKLTAPHYVEGVDKDQVVRVKQGRKEIHTGEMVSRDRALTLYIGQGEIEEDSVYLEGEDEERDVETDMNENNFNVQL